MTDGIQRTLAGDPIDIGRTYQLLGMISHVTGLSCDALKFYSSALSYYEASECHREIAIVCCNLGDLYLRQANHDLARATLSRAQQVTERIGDIINLPLILNNLGLPATRAEDVVEAEAYYKRGLSLTKLSNEQVDVCWLSISLAMSLQDQYRFSAYPKIRALAKMS